MAFLGRNTHLYGNSVLDLKIRRRKILHLFQGSKPEHSR